MSPLRHEPPYYTHPKVEINCAKLYEFTPVSFEGVKTRTHRPTELRFIVGYGTEFPNGESPRPGVSQGSTHLLICHPEKLFQT